MGKWVTGLFDVNIVEIEEEEDGDPERDECRKRGLGHGSFP